MSGTRVLPLLACAATSLLCASSTTAQNATIPPDFERQDGDSKIWISNNTPSRMLANYASHVTGLKGGNRILALYVRLNDLPASTTGYRPHKNVTVATRVSSGGVVPSGMGPAKWTAYEGQNKGAWSKKVVMSFPGSTTASPEPWIRLPHAIPHVVASDGSLAIDVKFWTAKTENIGGALDAQKVMNLGKFIRHGTGCPTTVNLTAGWWHFSPTRVIPYTFSTGHLAGDVVVAWLDGRSIDVPLGFKSGTAPCTLYVAPVLVHPIPSVVASSKNYAHIDWPADRILKSPAVKGVKVFAQHAAVTKNGRIQLSNGLSITIGWGYSKGWMGVYTVEGYNYDNRPKIYDPDVDPPIWGSSYAPIFGVIKA